MAKYYSLTLMPVTWTLVQDQSLPYIPELDLSRVVGAEHANTWISFPDEIEQSLKTIIEPYGYTTDEDDQHSNVRSMLRRVEETIRYQFLVSRGASFSIRRNINYRVTSYRSGPVTRFDFQPIR